MKNNFFSEFDNKFKNKEQNTLEGILNNIADQIKDRFNGIIPFVITSESSMSDFREMKLVLGLINNQYYSYNLIKITLPIDNEFPYSVSAFLNPPTEPIKFIEPDFSDLIRWVTNDVIGNIRMRVVSEYLLQINNSFSV